MFIPRTSLAASLLILASCAATSTPPAPAPTPDTVATHTDDEAIKLAQRLVLTFGYDRLRQVAQLNFRSVFQVGEDELFAAVHHWDLVNQRDRMVWTDPDGHRYDAVLHVQTGLAYGYVDGEEATGTQQTALTSKARARFAVDTHYLVLPMRLFDPDSHLVHGGQRDLDGHPMEILELYPEDPSSPVLRLFIDPSGYRVRRSEIAALDAPTPQSGAAWDVYRPVGPLLLPHEHRIDGGGDRRMVLQDVVALRSVDHRELLPVAAR